jgi:putative hydrolase of the HAD superfamily
VWLFDLDDTLHDASAHIFPHIHASMAGYIARHLSLTLEDATALRSHYWRRYGATLLGMMKHHAVSPRHFLWHTHQFDNLASLLVFEPQLNAVLRRIPGRKIVFSNGPRHYARQVLQLMGVEQHFDSLSAIEDTRFVPKPAIEGFRRLLRAEKLAASRCVLVEDSLANLRTAKRLGFTTVWVSRALHRPAYVDFKIKSVGNILDVMRRLVRADGSPPGKV